MEIIHALDDLRERGAPVQRMQYDGEVAHVVLGYDAVDQAFKNTIDLPSSTFFKVFTEKFFGFVLSTAEGEEHRFHRLQILPSFTPAAVRARAQDVLYPTAHALIDAFPVGKPFDFIEAYAEQVTFDVISALLGIPQDDRAWVRRSVTRLLHIYDPTAAAAARQEMSTYIRSLVDQRRDAPGDDLISQLMIAETGGRRFSDAELVDAVRFLYPAALENTANGLGLALHCVLSDNVVRRRVAESEGAQSAAVNETLRLYPPIPLLARYTDRATRIEGVDIPANSFVWLAISSANRDPRRYPDPAAFSLDRRVKDHLTFGRGVRLCVGIHLARAEIGVMLDLMLRRLPGLRLVPDAESLALGATFFGFKRLMITFDARLPAEAAAASNRLGGACPA